MIEHSTLSADALPPSQRLALAYAPAGSRARTLALFTLDARLGQILRGRREPLGAQLRLAWWREMLERPAGQWPAGEPVLDALRTWREPAALAALPSGWEALLEEALTEQAIVEFADARGAAFAALARELEVPGDAAASGRIWALADLAANMSAGAERQLAVDLGRALGPPPRLPRSLRPLAVLAALGAAALARGGGDLLAGPRSTFLALRIGLTGR